MKRTPDDVLMGARAREILAKAYDEGGVSYPNMSSNGETCEHLREAGLLKIIAKESWYTQYVLTASAVLHWIAD